MGLLPLLAAKIKITNSGDGAELAEESLAHL